MKKILIISLLILFGFGIYADARVKYDSRGRIIEDNTIRGRHRAQQPQQMQKVQQPQQTKGSFYAAAAKIEKKVDQEALRKNEEIQKMIDEDYNNNY